MMQSFPYTKKPAFFPFVSAELFFEASETSATKSDADDAESTEVEKVEVDNEALDRELDKILGLEEGDD